MTLVTSRVLTFINSSPCSDSWSGTCQIQIAICHVRLLWRMSSSRGLRRHTELTVMALSSFPGMTNFLSMIKKNHIVVVIKFNSGTLVKFTWHEQNFFSNKYWWFLFLFTKGTSYRYNQMSTSFCYKGPQSSTTTRRATSAPAVYSGCSLTTRPWPGVKYLFNQSPLSAILKDLFFSSALYSLL